MHQLRSALSTFAEKRRRQFQYLMGDSVAAAALTAKGPSASPIWGVTGWLILTVFEACGLLILIATYLIWSVFFKLPTPLRYSVSCLVAAFCVKQVIEQRWWVAMVFLLLVWIRYSVLVSHPQTRAKESKVLTTFPLALVYATSLALLAYHWVFYSAVLLFFGLMSNRLEDGGAIAEIEAIQRNKDRRASVLYRQAGLNHCPPFVLYLRPFWIANQQKFSDDPGFEEFRDENGKRHAFSLQNGEWVRREEKVLSLKMGLNWRLSTLEQNEDFESRLERCVGLIGPFVALGHPSGAIGAARLSIAGDDWRSAVTFLAKKASCCLVIPSTNSGTFWEVRWLIEQGLLSRCLFFMPPRTPFFNYKQAWTDIAQALGTDLALPSYDEGGCFLAFRSTGELARLRFEDNRFPDPSALEHFWGM